MSIVEDEECDAMGGSEECGYAVACERMDVWCKGCEECGGAIRFPA